MQNASPFAHMRALLSRHRALRILLCALLVLALLLFLLHPRGTKTFLILGIDNYGSLDVDGRSDVMMLVQIDFTHTDITTVTFARDRIIPDENGRDQKINTIVRSHDEDALVRAMEGAFDLSIDGWFRVNFSSLVLLVDAIGGCDVELTSKEVNYLNRTAGVYPDNPLSEGVCHLNGAQALYFARCRALDNDMGRGQRQNRVMAAMVRQTKNLGIGKIIGIFNSLNGVWQSSLSGGEQVRLLASALWLRGAQTTAVGLPFEGTWHYGDMRGDNGVIIKLSENTRLLHEALGLPVSAEEE